VSVNNDAGSGMNSTILDQFTFLHQSLSLKLEIATTDRAELRTGAKQLHHKGNIATAQNDRSPPDK
jgi:hypothetical protein